MPKPKRYALDTTKPDEGFYTVEEDAPSTWRWYWQGDVEGTDLDMGRRGWQTRALALGDAAHDAAVNIGGQDGRALAGRLRTAAALTARQEAARG